MDNPKKPPTSGEGTAPRPAMLHPSALSPFRPLSRRRRQQQGAEPVPVVERPNTSLVFDASPTTIAAQLSKAGRPPAEPVRLAWTRSPDGSAPVAGEPEDIEIEPVPPPDAT